MNGSPAMSSDEKLDEIRSMLRDQRSEISSIQKKLNCIENRLESAEKVTDPAREIFSSAWDKFVFGAGWLLLAGLSLMLAWIVGLFTDLDLSGLFG